jgi:hypothetical protein
MRQTLSRFARLWMRVCESNNPMPRNEQLSVFRVLVGITIVVLLLWWQDHRTGEQRAMLDKDQIDLQTQSAREDVSVQEEIQKKMRASIEEALAPLPEDWWKPRKK